MSAFVPNADQAKFFNDFYQFLLDPNERVYRLTGAGGTGKTASMLHVINVVFPKYHEACEMLGIQPEYVDISLTATTNKAAEELSAHTGLPCVTIHSLLGIVVKPRAGSRESDLILKATAVFQHNALIIVDEASMCCPDTLKFIMDRTVNCKILFVGDAFQLKPVGHNYSPVYSGPGPTSVLTISERNKASPELQALCTQLRETIAALEAGVDPSAAFKNIQTAPGAIDHLDPDQMDAEFATYFSVPRDQQPLDTRVIAFRNERVREYNDYARNLRGMPRHFTRGEILINNRVVEFGSVMIHTDKEVTVIDIAQPRMIDLPFDCELEVQSATLAWGGTRAVIDVPVDGSHLNAVVSYIGKKCNEVRNFQAYHQVKAKFPDLRQRDALTGHKSQGSSYDTVFIDAADLSRCYQPDTFARLLYVAVSRARSRVVFYDQFSHKYGQII